MFVLWSPNDTLNPEERWLQCAHFSLFILYLFGHDQDTVLFQMQVRLYLLALLMVPISLGCILLGIQCLGFPFHHFMAVPILSHMLFQLVELYMDQLELFLTSLHQEVADSGLGVAVLVLLLAVIFHTTKAPSKLLEILALLSTFLLWRIQTASHLWVVHYLNLGLLIMSVILLSISIFMPNFYILSHYDGCALRVSFFCVRCQFKGQAKHFVMDFPWQECLRYLLYFA